MKQYFVFFKNSIDAYNLSQKLTDIDITLAPTPREADYCCGVCLIYKNPEDKAHIEKIAQETGIELGGFWEREGGIDPDRMKFC
ncbi:MAG: putative Se/S carrier-like protein [Ezakiella massiliensis]